MPKVDRDLMNIKMEPGSFGNLKAKEPVISIVGKGSVTYLWIGNDAENDKSCYAILSSRKALRLLAMDILRRLEKHPSRQPIKNK